MKNRFNFYLMAIFSLFLSTGFASKLQAEDECNSALRDHLQVIEQSEEFLLKFNNKSSDITANEITKIQKNLTNRFLSLKSFLKVYEDASLSCSPHILSEAIALYDFSLSEKSIFSDKEMRRIVISLTKYFRYELTDFLDYHKKYTSNKLISRVQKELEENNFILPIEFNFKKSLASIKNPIHRVADSTLEGTKSIVGGLARVWGFLSDHLKWRQGRLNNNIGAQTLLLANLRPLDLLYEKRSFLLSDYTIPGHWGHVGIWLGSKEELIALGVWDQEYFKPFQSFVEEGMNILEIRKEGLNFQSLSTFLNLDEIAVNRVNGALLRAEEIFSELNLQIDKKYDFKFDAKTSDKITCSELIAFSYGDVNWKGTKSLNQVSLSPDDLAVLTLEPKNGVEFIMYLKGIKKSEEFLDMGFEKWKSNFNIKKEKTNEEIKVEEEQKAKLQRDLLYIGG